MRRCADFGWRTNGRNGTKYRERLVCGCVWVVATLAGCSSGNGTSESDTSAGNTSSSGGSTSTTTSSNATTTSADATSSGMAAAAAAAAVVPALGTMSDIAVTTIADGGSWSFETLSFEGEVSDFAAFVDAEFE